MRVGTRVGRNTYVSTGLIGTLISVLVVLPIIGAVWLFTRLVRVIFQYAVPALERARKRRQHRRKRV